MLSEILSIIAHLLPPFRGCIKLIGMYLSRERTATRRAETEERYDSQPDSGPFTKSIRSSSSTASF